MSETAGQTLKRIRLAQGYNQTELAERSRVSKNYISLLEADKVAQPRPYQIEKIEKALGVPANELRSRFLGVATKKPENVHELIDALADIGIDIGGFAADLSNATPEDLEEIKEQIAATVGVKVSRINKR